MEFNTIFYCLILWAVVILCSSFISALRGLRMKRIHELKKVYMQRVIAIAATGLPTNKLIRELYYSFINEKRLRQILIRAVKRTPEAGFAYINKHLSCEPIMLIHNYLLSREKHLEGKGEIPKDIIAHFENEIEKWDQEYEETLSSLKKARRKTFIFGLFFTILNLFMYSRIKTGNSLMIYAIVDTIGVIWSIILDYECSVVDERMRAGNPAWIKFKKKKTQFLTKGITNVYQLAAGLGLILNITTVVAGWLGPIA
ncbi:hypothetical protein SAMN02910298_02836 [Pseudobutyrivibrio sp. YE44]|uniref:hypothetical protein n=1 Tax=Pseudobutyrivibrio sp. YE44 TaxID=1520802 RepID=UPI00089268EC|nr:hypothetical protein [Pseudobutyrivibrio sp. YE44]SDB55176.1 hypothetical protein SAMN02910298_02836 [Pseudobutyrivibrio sp. YE44]